MYQRAGTIVEIHCRTRGMLSIGNISPDSSIVGIIRPIPEAIIAAIWVSTIVEIRRPRHRVQIRNRIGARGSESGLPEVGATRKNKAHVVAVRSRRGGSPQQGRAHIEYLIREVVAEDHHKAGLAFSEYVVDPVDVCDPFADVEIFTGIHPFDDACREFVIYRVEHGHGGVAHLGGDGESEQQKLRDRHPDYDEQSPPVSKDMSELLLYES